MSAAPPEQAIPRHASDADLYRQRAEAGEIAYDDLVRQPRLIEPSLRRLFVYDVRHDPTPGWKRALQFGAVVAGLFAILVQEVRRGLLTLDPWSLAAVLGVAGVTAASVFALDRVRAARRQQRLGAEAHAGEATPDAVPLASIDLSRGWLRVRERPDQESLTESEEIPVESVREVLYAVRKVPTSPDGSRGLVDGAGVFVRLDDGTVWPIIPSTLASDDAYRVARMVAVFLEVGVKQVGRGWSDESS